MSVADPIAAWLAGRCPAEAELIRRIATQLAEARLAGDTARAIDPSDAQRLVAVGCAATDPEAPLTVRDGLVAWSACARDENDLATRFALLASAPASAMSPVQSVLVAVGQDAGQDAAVRLAVERRLAVIVGGPGTGKTTTVVRALAALLAGGDCSIRLAAPTGKAAARLRAAVERGLPQVPEASREAIARAAREATTVHRLLGWDVASARFAHGASRRLAAEVVVIDEASMLDVHLAAGLARALAPRARLILLGDDAQLPSVEAGAVLRDTVAGFPASVVRLTTVHRQAGAADGLRALAPALRDGDAAAAEAVLAAGHADAQRAVHAQAWPAVRHLVEPWVRSVVTAADPGAALAALAGVLVLAATREGPWGVAELHQRIENLLGVRVSGAAPHHAHGRPLLITANDHRLGLANGDLGVLWQEDGQLRACFPDGAGGVRRLAPARLPACETGWVTTVHKAQGSEAASVVVSLPPVPHPLANRELVYTAVTRARERLLLIGDAALLTAALASREQRSTWSAGLLPRPAGGTPTPR
jgi:exodeoxyribonuclease V alpha subunit